MKEKAFIPPSRLRRGLEMERIVGGVITAIMLLFIPMAIAGVILYLNREAKRAENKRYITVMALVDAGAIALTAAVFASFELVWYNKALYAGIGVVVELLLIAWMTRRLNRKTVPVLLCLLVLLIGGRVGTGYYDRYVESIRVKDTFDAYRYRPFEENSLVKTLDETATLTLTGTPPRMDGATALYPVYAAFGRAVYPDSMWNMTRGERLDYIDCSTTSVAYRNIVNGSADIIFVAGPSAEQEAYAREKGVELVYTPIGREAFVFFVNPANPIESLTLSQIRDIYSGKITRWEELGIQGLGTIQAFQRSKGSGSQTALEKLMGDQPLMEAPTEMKMGGMLDIVEATADYKNFKNAVGYSFRFYCTELITDFDVKLLAVNGVPPTRENIENGTYPIASYFYAVTRPDADENTLALLDWIQGPQGQKLIDETGYTPVNGTAAKGEET